LKAKTQSEHLIVIEIGDTLIKVSFMTPSSTLERNRWRWISYRSAVCDRWIL